MKDKFQNKYRIPSARLQNWDYGSEGNYFITICTHGREHYFGEIITDMNLSSIGQLATQYWAEIPAHFPFIELGNFVVMPNHVHGILIIHKRENINHAQPLHDPVETLQCNVSITPQMLPGCVETLQECVETLQCNVSTTTRPGKSFIDPAKREQMSKISPHAGSVSTIVRSFKSAVTKYAHSIHPEFEWQARFHDHIIRDAASFDRIQNYIENNPENWDTDTFNQKP